MLTDVSRAHSSPVIYPNLVESKDSTSSPGSYVSLLDSRETPDRPALSLSQRATNNWSRTFSALRQWSSRTLKYTRQLFHERTGRAVRTQDVELEQNIQLLYETKHQYEHVLNQARQMKICFSGLIETQRSLGESFGELQRTTRSSDDLIDQFVRSSLCHNALAQNGAALLNAMNTFIDRLQVLTDKTMEDTLNTIKKYENARIEYDAYRYDYELLLSQNRSAESASCKDEEIQRQYECYKQRYERLKADVTIKLKLLEENRVQVMNQQLMLFHHAIISYFCVNRQQLHL